jgi:crotonobetainyl-CoA:carnitine CoA-transferase CaiB-like acyl-CoA transferase
MRDANVPFSKVNNARDFITSDIAAASGAYVDIEDPELGTIRHLNHPAKYSVSPADVSRRAPKIGEHTDEILAMIAADDQAEN